MAESTVVDSAQSQHNDDADANYDSQNQGESDPARAAKGLRLRIQRRLADPGGLERFWIELDRRARFDLSSDRVQHFTAMIMIRDEQMLGQALVVAWRVTALIAGIECPQLEFAALQANRDCHGDFVLK